MSAILRYPKPEDGAQVSIAGSFNGWQPEAMHLSKDGKYFEKTLEAPASKKETHTYKFVLPDGTWVLQDGQPTTSDENGVMNHKVDVEPSALDGALDASLESNDQVDRQDHVPVPDSVKMPRDIGSEVIDKTVANNQYSDGEKHSDGNGAGLVDATDSSIAVGDQSHSTSSSSHALHDSHLNPAAPAFNPNAAVFNPMPVHQPFVPASNPPRHAQNGARSSHRQRSQSRTRQSHSRSSSIVSQRPRAGSNVHHDELNPAAHEFKPQFAQPTHHVPHASGYAAALKKPATPPLKEEFKKPHPPPAKSTSPHEKVTSSTPGNNSAVHNEPANNGLSYAKVAEHAAVQGSSEKLATKQPLSSPASQTDHTPRHGKDPILSDALLDKGASNSGSAMGSTISQKSELEKRDDRDLARAVEESQSSPAPTADTAGRTARSESKQLSEQTVDPMVEELKQHASEIKEDIVTKATDVNEHSQEKLSEIKEKATSSAEKVQSTLTDAKNTARETLSEGIDTQASSIKDSADELSSSVSNAVQHTKSVVWEQSEGVQESLSSAKATVDDKVTEVQSIVKEKFEETKQSATEIKDNIVAAVQDHASTDISQTKSSAASVDESKLETTSLSVNDYDAEQIRLMDEVCILLDRDDRPIGRASKKDAHLMSNINDGLLHRAFSLFIFDSQDRLLLQQRATEKITFPDMWTNTCCSHPLSISGEVADDLKGSIAGVKRAAQRKVDQELGIAASEAPTEKMEFLTRIHYLAPSDGKWGEHEIDYILFLRADPKLKVNPNEVRDHKWVSQDELRQMFQSTELSYTPWFKLICETFLYGWWDQLKSSSLEQDSKIHRLGLDPALYEKIAHTADSPTLEAETSSSQRTSEMATGPIKNLTSGAQETISSAAEIVSRQIESLTAQASELKSNLADGLSSMVDTAQETPKSANDNGAKNMETSEPAAENSLPPTCPQQPPAFEEFPEIAAPKTDVTSTTPKIDATSEPAAEDANVPLVETRDAVESEVQESFSATNAEADAAVASKAPEPVLELSATGQAKAAAHAHTSEDPESVSRPSTGKSIRAKQNFFIYIFNSLFGGIFKGFRGLFDKLAFWRKSPHPHSE